MHEKTVYNELHTYAFKTLNNFISNPLEKKEIKSFAESFLLSSQLTGEKAKESLYHNTIANFISTKVNINMLQKNINDLTPSENLIFENAKDNIKKLIGEEINKKFPNEIKKEVQKEEIESAKKDLEQNKISVIEDTKGNQFIKIDDEKQPLVTEMVGNATVASMIDEDASFIIDGSVSNIKNAEEIKKDFKENKITNAYTMESLNVSNNDNLSNEAKEEIGILKSSNINLDGAKYDTTTGLAFTSDGKVLDTEIKENGTTTINELESNNVFDLPKNKALEEKEINMSKTQLIAYISELEEKGVSREEASSTLKQINSYNNLSDVTKENLLDNFHSLNNEKQHTKKLVNTMDNTNSKAGIASSIIVSFVSGIITGVVIMLLVYFFLTH